MDIAHTVDRVLFCGTLRSGGLAVDVDSGRLSVYREGRIARAVQRAQAICFNGPKICREGKEVLYLTERASVRLTTQGVELFEIAPGVDLEPDVLSKMEFRPRVASDLHLMDERIFRPGRMGSARNGRGTATKAADRA